MNWFVRLFKEYFQRLSRVFNKYRNRIMFKASESNFIIVFLIVGALIGLWFAHDQQFLSSGWAQKFFAAQSAISVISTLVFRIVSAESRYRSSEQTRKIESIAREISSIIPLKFQESARHFERKFKKIEHEANVRYNRQMMSQEEEVREFWHYQQDFGREDTLNIFVKHQSESSDGEFQDDYEVKILGTYESREGGFSKTFYIVKVLAARARGVHNPIFEVGEKLACSYSNTPRISRTCDHFGNQSYEFHIGGRIGTITYGEGLLARDVPIEMRLVDQMGSD